MEGKLLYTGMLQENNNLGAEQWRMLEENNNFGGEQRSYFDNEFMHSSFLRLEKNLESMMLAILEPKLTEFEGRLVKLELAFNELSARVKSNTEHDAHNTRQRCLNLQFSDRVSSPILTGGEIKGVGGDYIKVALVDETGKLVESGPESSADVRLFALKGEVDDNEGDSGENQLYDISRNRKAKNLSFLVGDVQLKLTKGIGILAKIKFRSSSSHVGGMFKIGARVVDRFDGIVIQDAKTVSFRVKDYRVKYNEKHRPPCLSDEIWRLDNIGRGGSIHKRLKEQNFNTVEDFLIQHLKDSELLKKLVDLQPKKWEATVKHALTCQLDERVYCSIISKENKGIVFSAVGKVLGVIFDSKYLRLDELSDKAKVNASKPDIAAYLREGEIFHFADEASLLLQQFPEPVSALHPSIDHEEEASEVVDSHQTNLDTPIEDVPSSSSRPLEIEEYFDQQFIESLLADHDNHQNSGFSDMRESSAVSNNEVKKKLFFLFTFTKWLLNYERVASCDGNYDQKRRRISE